MLLKIMNYVKSVRAYKMNGGNKILVEKIGLSTEELQLNIAYSVESE